MRLLLYPFVISIHFVLRCSLREFVRLKADPTNWWLILLRIVAVVAFSFSLQLWKMIFSWQVCCVACAFHHLSILFSRLFQCIVTSSARTDFLIVYSSIFHLAHTPWQSIKYQNTRFFERRKNFNIFPSFAQCIVVCVLRVLSAKWIVR